MELSSRCVSLLSKCLHCNCVNKHLVNLSAESYEADGSPASSVQDRNNNDCSNIIRSSPLVGSPHSPSTSSSDRDSLLSPENYHDEELYGKLKVKVRKDGKKLTEKKRRQDVQQQYSNLTVSVPGLQDVEGQTPFSRNVILKSTLAYLEQLKASVRSSHYLVNELRLAKKYNQRLEREMAVWQKRVSDLRERRNFKKHGHYAGTEKQHPSPYSQSNQLSHSDHSRAQTLNQSDIINIR